MGNVKNSFFGTNAAGTCKGCRLSTKIIADMYARYKDIGEISRGGGRPFEIRVF